MGIATSFIHTPQEPQSALNESTVRQRLREPGLMWELTCPLDSASHPTDKPDAFRMRLTADLGPARTHAY